MNKKEFFSLSAISIIMYYLLTKLGIVSGKKKDNQSLKNISKIKKIKSKDTLKTIIFYNNEFLMKGRPFKKTTFEILVKTFKERKTDFEVHIFENNIEASDYTYIKNICDSNQIPLKIHESLKKIPKEYTKKIYKALKGENSE